MLFAIALIDASVIGAIGGLAVDRLCDRRRIRGCAIRCTAGSTEAKGFYAVYFLLIAVAAALVLTPGAPLGLLTNAVQTLAGVLLPSATVFLLLLCNDRAVLGPWVNSRWLNYVHRRRHRRAGDAVGDPDRFGAVPRRDRCDRRSLAFWSAGGVAAP